MLEPSHNALLPAIPNKRYFIIGEVGELCNVKPHVLRYWEQEFPQLSPVKRRGNRRYYQKDNVLMIRRKRRSLNPRLLKRLKALRLLKACRVNQWLCSRIKHK